MRYRLLAVCVGVAVLLSGCTEYTGRVEPEMKRKELAVGDRFLAVRGPTDELQRLERNVVRPGNRFLFVMEDITGLASSSTKGYAYSIDVWVKEEPAGETVFEREDVEDGTGEAVVDGTLSRVDVGITTPESVAFGAYTVRARITDKVGNRSAVVEQSLIVATPDSDRG